MPSIGDIVMNVRVCTSQRGLSQSPITEDIKFDRMREGITSNRHGLSRYGQGNW
jgi:hypothetical protein